MGSIPDPGRSHMPWTNQVRVPQLLRLCSRAWEPQLLKPAWPRAHALQQEKSPAMRSCALQPALPHSPQLEKSRHSNEDPAQPKIMKLQKRKKVVKCPPKQNHPPTLPKTLQLLPCSPFLSVCPSLTHYFLLGNVGEMTVSPEKRH